MAVKTYSMKKDWNKKVSAHFSVYEFACSDHSDTVLIDTSLIDVLEQIRTHFGKPVKINSAYRTPAYNISIGGSSKSQHPCPSMRRRVVSVIIVVWGSRTDSFMSMYAVGSLAGSVRPVLPM